MTLEIQQPELVALLEKRMQDGSYARADAMLIDLAYFGIRSDEDLPQAHNGTINLVEACKMVRGLTDDLDFSRDSSPGRPAINFAD